MGLIANIKERRITQIVVGYLAAGWMVLAVFDQFADREIVSDLVYRIALTLYLFGIPAALVLGWHHGEKGKQKATPFEILQLGLIGVLGLGAILNIVRQDFAARDARQLLALESNLDLRTVAVLYFDATDDELVPLADGFTEALIERLSAVRDLDVISANGVAPYRGSDLFPDSIASVLQAGTVIDGRVDRSGDNLRVNVRMIDGQSGTEIGSLSPTWPADDLLTVREELPVEVARQFREILGGEIGLRTARRSTSSTQAWLLVQRAQKSVKDAEAARAAEDRDAAVAAYQSADAELEQAARMDPEWVEPLLARGWIAYDLLSFARNLEQALELLSSAEERANEALALEQTSAQALELRGITRYRRWSVNRAFMDGPDAEELFRTAREDLERAQGLEGSLARTLSTLSHLYYQIGDRGAAVLAARRAYEEDAYLESAADVLERLYLTSFDLDEYGQASDWCDEGRRRFPAQFRFYECQIWVMTMSASDPDIEEAWRLLDEVRSRIPEDRRTLPVAKAKIGVGGVIARAGLADSARAVMAAARQEGEPADQEGDLIAFEAANLLILGDRDAALAALERYTLNHPGHFSAERALHWWWDDLRNEPRFQSLRQMN